MTLQRRITTFELITDGWLRQHERQYNLLIYDDLKTMIFCFTNRSLEWNEYQSQTHVLNPVIKNSGKTATILANESNNDDVKKNDNAPYPWDDAIFLTNFIIDTRNLYKIESPKHRNTMYMNKLNPNMRYCSLKIAIEWNDKNGWKPSTIELGLQDITNDNNLNIKSGCYGSNGNYSWRIQSDFTDLYANKKHLDYTSTFSLKSKQFVCGLIMQLVYDHKKQTIHLNTDVNRTLKQSDENNKSNDNNSSADTLPDPIIEFRNMFLDAKAYTIPPSRYKWYLRITCEPRNYIHSIVTILNEI